MKHSSFLEIKFLKKTIMFFAALFTNAMNGISLDAHQQMVNTENTVYIYNGTLFTFKEK